MTRPRRNARSGIRLSGHHSIFDRFAGLVTRAAGSPTAFIAAAVVVAIWASTGPMFGYSDTWQIVINTGTTIVTFLMVFLIQQSQNKDSLALHIKLNELIAAQASASNRLVCIEDLDEEDLQTLRAFYAHLAKLSREEGEVDETHSLAEARQRHGAKQKQRVRKSPADNPKNRDGSQTAAAVPPSSSPPRRRRRKPRPADASG